MRTAVPMADRVYRLQHVLQGRTQRWPNRAEMPLLKSHHHQPPKIAPAQARLPSLTAAALFRSLRGHRRIPLRPEGQAHLSQWGRLRGGRLGNMRTKRFSHIHFSARAGKRARRAPD